MATLDTRFVLCSLCRNYQIATILIRHDRAREAGIVILNELGLDPGIDHASAMSLIEQARSTGSDIVSFVSFCGGLPSPESSDGPLGKLSLSSP